MSVRFTAVTQRYTRSSLSFSSLNVTLMCWVKRATDTGTNAVSCALYNSALSAYGFTSDAGGDVAVLDHGVSGGEDVNINGVTFVNGEWDFLCGSRAGTGTNSMKFYYAVGGAALSVTQGTVTGSFTITDFSVADLQTVGAFFNGTVANVKIWSAGLTQAEVELERWQYQPLITANLVAWYPFFEGGATTNALTDYSGNARTLSGGTGSTTDTSPPIVWAPSQRAYPVPVTVAGAPGLKTLGLLGVGR